MIINGVDISALIRIRQINRQLAPSIENQIFDIPGRHGAYHIRNLRKLRRIEVDYAIVGEDVADRIEKAHQLAGLLATEDDLTIVLPDEPDRVYFGSLSGETDLDEVRHTAQGVLVFVCADPYAVAIDESTGVFDSNGELTAINEGSAETYPKFTVTFTEQTTHFEILNHDLIDPATGTPQAIRLGMPEDIEQTPVDPLTLVLHDTMGSTSGWQAGVSVDGGVIAGQMASDGTKFYASDFGTGSDWHGPALRRILASPVQDFIMEARVQLNNLIGQSGRVEIYLFDQNDQVIGKIAIKDSKANSRLNYVEARAGGLAGGTYFIAEAGDNPGVWNNFDGVLRLERNGARWQAYVAKIAPDGTHYARRTRYLTDSLGQYMNALASVQVHIAAGGEYEPTEMSISELRVYRINQVQEDQEVPYIAYPGDVIEIDCGLNRVTRNGAVANQIIALENQFFPLRVGQNTLELFPKGAAEVEASWRRRWV